MKDLDQGSELIVITGKNLPSRSAENNRTEAAVTTPEDIFENGSGIPSFRLVNEIQSVLVEQFYPSISSSTVPNNPGRIIIHLKDIH